MIFSSIFGIAFNAIITNKLRSTLTFLGIVVGVTSVMTIISALEGMAGAIEADLARLGPSTFFVQKGFAATSHEEWLEIMRRKPLDIEAVELIEEGCTLCENITPSTGTRAKVKYGNNTLRNVSIRASYANFIDMLDLDVAMGRFHSTQDDLHRRKVAFIGDKIKESFFAQVDPIGKEIKINGIKYTVIGVAKKQGQALGGDNEDLFVRIPYSTFTKQFGSRQRWMSFIITAKSVEVLDEAMDQARVILRSQRHVPYNEPDDFAILTADMILDFLNQITKSIRFGLVAISSISLVVGGIVVMNIMMVSVTERTREIGIRKSIGAKRSHIMMQFLFESLILTFSGGMLGVILGFLIARSLVGLIDMQIDPSALAIIAGLTISTGIGLIFGIYPAMKAARLDPIKALSYE